MHYTGMETAELAEERLCHPAAEVSSHYLVYENGHVVQMVREEERAWHAGRGSWKGSQDVNARSIGIEIANVGYVEGKGFAPFPDIQIAAVIRLSRDIIARNNIPPEHVLGHSDVAPGRKIDPGDNFPWARLAAEGVGHWVEPVEPTLADAGREVVPFGDAAVVQTMLQGYGYGIECTGKFDEQTERVVTAFQLHFRQKRVDGIADASTVRTLEALASKLTVNKRM
ncbi:N-acetylmuramoyl-L-alanine amidase [Limoniibacter endophyticus]|uniref:N-acetylmuramoyl-L-alanine amidase n=2 Tax=Limoniibacter endophyticus TaxID=1565040 RepID=A0A8J3GHZ6_9HYPH|nr:N-acetylmuramoyl-L-alanine amidase [Limoniibacter endophyticus]